MNTKKIRITHYLKLGFVLLLIIYIGLLIFKLGVSYIASGRYDATSLWIAGIVLISAMLYSSISVIIFTLKYYKNIDDCLLQYPELHIEDRTISIKPFVVNEPADHVLKRFNSVLEEMTEYSTPVNSDGEGLVVSIVNKGWSGWFKGQAVMRINLNTTDKSYTEVAISFTLDNLLLVAKIPKYMTDIIQISSFIKNTDLDNKAYSELITQITNLTKNFNRNRLIGSYVFFAGCLFHLLMISNFDS